MAYTIQQNESNASRRVVYLWCATSNGTSPATGEAGGQPQWSLGGVYKGNTANTISNVSAAAGEYFVLLSQSEVSVVGQGVVRYNSATALETSTPFQVVAYDSGDSMRLGLFALPNAAANATSGLPTIGNNYSSTLTVGVASIAPATYSGVTVDANAVIAAGDYSSTLTFGVGAVSVGAGQSIADRMLARSIGGGNDSSRSVGQALYILRNKVDASGSVMTVYNVDDVTSAYTASITTAQFPLGSSDPD